ncbi:MAG TPA: hypothetical protein VI386_32325 [Candidatus Sulfotelmatobacter sp.]
MPNQRLTLADINQQNRQFWLEQSELLSQRIQDATLHEIAMADLSAEAAMRVPVRNRKSLEQALSQAEKSLSIFQRNFSSKGGKAVKVDGLQGVILEIVRAKPDINTQRLLQKLRKMASEGHPVVRKVDRKWELLDDQTEQIHFKNGGMDKTSPVSGLKDRLARAKRKILSR